MQAGAALASLATRLRSVAGQPAQTESSDAFARDERAAGDALARLDPARDRLVAFVGKLIVSKGVDLLLAAWPLVLERVPRSAPGDGRLRRLSRRLRAPVRDTRGR